MQHVFHPPAEYSFEKVGVKGKTFESRSLNDKIEFTVIETDGGHETKIIEKECLFSYLILDGEGSFEIGEDIEKCQKGDLVIIPMGIAFKYTGKMRMLLVSTPWYFPEQEVTLN
jgi:mannose-6-phosphate isomerase-like protein (cupin superfamily)